MLKPDCQPVAFLVQFGLGDYGGLFECGAVGSKLSRRYAS